MRPLLPFACQWRCRRRGGGLCAHDDGKIIATMPGYSSTGSYVLLNWYPCKPIFAILELDTSSLIIFVVPFRFKIF